MVRIRKNTEVHFLVPESWSSVMFKELNNSFSNDWDPKICMEARLLVSFGAYKISECSCNGP